MTEGIARRAPAPRREDYAVVDGSRGPRRDFRITVGLREGWDAEGRVYDVSEAVRTARAWMGRRVGASLPALSGMFTRAEVTYAWPRPDGSAGSDREPVAVFTGEAVHAYLGQLPDSEIEAMLNELAVELLGMDGALADPEGFRRAFLFGPALTIGGGTTEVQKNILAQRVLGLPRP